MPSEYLNLIANVTDAFSDELLELGTMLEGVGEMADRIDPIRIDVEVYDNELDQLMGKMGVLDGLSTENIGIADSGGVGVGDGGQMADIETMLANVDTAIFNGASGSAASAATNAVQHTATADGSGSGYSPLFEGSGIEHSVAEGMGGAVDGDALRSATRMSSSKERLDLIDSDTLSLDGLRESITEMDVGMSDFYDILATMLPLLFTFVGAMPAAIAAVGGLATAAVGAAAALGAIGGLGLMGAAMAQNGGGMPSMEDIGDVLDELPNEFFEAFSGIAEQLAPTFESGLEGLYTFFDELADRGDVLLNLREEAEAFGGFLLNYLPNAIAALGQFADAASPIFGGIGQWLMVTDIIGGLAEVTNEALPALYAITNIIVDAIPSIIRLSIGFLEMSAAILGVMSVIGGFIKAAVTLFGIFDGGLKWLGVGIGMFLAMTTVVLALKKLWTTWNALTMLTAGKTLPALISSLSLSNITLMGTAAALAKVAAMAVVATGGLALVGAGVSALASKFSILDGNISSATDSLSDFDSMQGNYGGGSMSMGSGAYIDITDNSSTTVEAPDEETGTAVADYHSYRSGSSLDQYFS